MKLFIMLFRIFFLDPSNNSSDCRFFILLWSGFLPLNDLTVIIELIYSWLRKIWLLGRWIDLFIIFISSRRTWVFEIILNNRLSHICVIDKLWTPEATFIWIIWVMYLAKKIMRFLLGFATSRYEYKTSRRLSFTGQISLHSGPPSLPPTNIIPLYTSTARKNQYWRTPWQFSSYQTSNRSIIYGIRWERRNCNNKIILSFHIAQMISHHKICNQLSLPELYT